MNEQQTLNLEEMDEREAARFLSELASELSAEKEYEARHREDYVMEMPQSGERFRGRDNMRAFQRSYPEEAGLPKIQIRRVLVREGLWVVESAVDYGGPIALGGAILELRDGKVWRDTRYFAEPSEAPEWRAQWVEKMEPGDTPDELRKESSVATDGDDVERLMKGQFAKMRAGNLVGAHEWYDGAVVVEWPQSGERVRGKENLLALRQAYPADVEFEVRRIVASPDLGVGEYVIRYDDRPVHVLAIAEFGDGKVVRETHYFAEPFDAPAWRARWVEEMEK